MTKINYSDHSIVILKILLEEIRRKYKKWKIFQSDLLSISFLIINQTEDFFVHIFSANDNCLRIMQIVLLLFDIFFLCHKQSINSAAFHVFYQVIFHLTQSLLTRASRASKIQITRFKHLLLLLIIQNF